MKSSFLKEGKLGEGAYGIVYQAKLENNDTVQKVAIKRNYGDSDSIGISCIREMNFLSMFQHPCITKLKTISIGDPFDKKCPMTPRPKRHDMVEDSHHFVLEYSDKCLENFYMECDNFFHIKIIICQILLGMEYIHSKKVLHRDLKPGNVLVSLDGDMPYAKICDFGLSCYPTNYRPSTPGAVTSWYRAPEICCHYDDYSFPSDMWSIGCIIFEIISKKPLIQTEKDSDKHIFRDIINTIPEKFTSKYVNEYIKKGDCKKFKHGYTDKLTPKKTSFETKINKSIDINDFNSTDGSITEICDILNKILILDPEKRMTATETLEHPFFNVLRPFINDMRKEHPPIPEPPNDVHIIDCIERRWAVNLVIKLYNKRDELNWYSDHIIFHSIRLFDEYLDKFYREDNISMKNRTVKGVGKLNTELEVNIYFYTCIYIMYKYFSTLYRIYTWDNIFPPYISTKENKGKIIKFERFIVKNICNYIVFKPTLIEYLDRDYKKQDYEHNDLDIMKYLYNYVNINVEYTGNMEDLYLQIKHGL